MLKQLCVNIAHSLLSTREHLSTFTLPLTIMSDDDSNEQPSQQQQQQQQDDDDVTNEQSLRSDSNQRGDDDDDNASVARAHAADAARAIRRRKTVAASAKRVRATQRLMYEVSKTAARGNSILVLQMSSDTVEPIISVGGDLASVKAFMHTPLASPLSHLLMSAHASEQLRDEAAAADQSDDDSGGDTGGVSNKKRVRNRILAPTKKQRRREVAEYVRSVNTDTMERAHSAFHGGKQSAMLMEALAASSVYNPAGVVDDKERAKPPAEPLIGPKRGPRIKTGHIKALEEATLPSGNYRTGMAALRELDYHAGDVVVHAFRANDALRTIADVDGAPKFAAAAAAAASAKQSNSGASKAIKKQSAAAVLTSDNSSSAANSDSESASISSQPHPIYHAASKRALAAFKSKLPTAQKSMLSDNDDDDDDDEHSMASSLSLVSLPKRASIATAALSASSASQQSSQQSSARTFGSRLSSQQSSTHGFIVPKTRKASSSQSK
jgi:hypothetical protein